MGIADIGSKTYFIFMSVNLASAVVRSPPSLVHC